MIVVDTLSASLSQSQAPDVVECVIFTLADVCCRMRAHVAEAVADVMAAVALSRGTNHAVQSQQLPPSSESSVGSTIVMEQAPPLSSSTAPTAPTAMQSYSSFRRSLDGEILKDMLVPHMRSLHKGFSRVLLAVADVCWGLVGNSNGGFVTQACNLLREVLAASSSLAVSASLAAAAAKATPSIFETSLSHGSGYDVGGDDGDGDGDDHHSGADDAADDEAGDDTFSLHTDAFMHRVMSKNLAGFTCC